MRQWSLALSILLAAVAAGPGTAIAEDYPSKPIRLVVPFAPGGVDVVARLVGGKLSELIKQPVVVEHRPGAGGNIGADAVAKAPPDGYTILLTAGGLAASPSLYRALPFDPVKDLVPVTQVLASRLVLVATPKLPVASTGELIALAKSKPGSLNYGSSGIGAPLHLTMEMFKSAAGVEIVHVPYKGDAPLNAALIAGDIQVAFVPISTGLPLIKDGRLRALGVIGAQRSATAPEVPTLAEAGVAGFEIPTWNGVFAPANTPRAIVLRLQQEIANAIRAPEVGDRLRGLGNEPVGSTPEEFDALFKADVRRLARAIEQAGIPKQ